LQLETHLANIAVKQQIYSLLGREPMQPVYDRLLGYLLRLKGYSNFPVEGGDLDLSGEKWFIANVLRGMAGVVIDIGANKGEYSLELLRHTKSTVYAVEPLPQELARLRAATHHFGERCVVVPVAISNVSGTSVLTFNPAATETASLSAEISDLAYRHEQQVSVEVLTLDDMVARYGLDRIDLIKIDVEGMEVPCLEGAKHTLATLRPRFIQVEFHWHHLFTQTTVHKLHGLLEGYRGYRLLPSGWCRVDPRSTLDNIYAYSNIVFVRDGVRG
jgi:FkbM family methyltransferase